jgi:hypothetical protein
MDGFGDSIPSAEEMQMQQQQVILAVDIFISSSNYHKRACL